MRLFKVGIVSLVCCLVIPLVPVSSVATFYQTITAYGSISYSGALGIYGMSGNFGELTAEQIANIFDMSQSWYVDDPYGDYTQKMNAVHMLNPDYKALVYRNVGYISSSATDEWNLASSSGWLLRDSSGKLLTPSAYPDLYLVDVGNPDYQNWVTSKVKSYLDRFSYFSGVFLDNGLYAFAKALFWEGDPINPRTGGLFTDQEIITAYIQVHTKIKNAIGSKLLIGNGVWNGLQFYGHYNQYAQLILNSPFDGYISEGCWYEINDQWFTEDEWKASLDFLVWTQDNFLSSHPNGYCIAMCYSTLSLPPGCTQEQLTLYGFCSTMLGVKYTDQNVFGFSGNGASETLNNFPELRQLAQKLRSVDMIEPLNDYYKIGFTSVYARDFVKGKVMVNPTDSPYTIALDRSYTTLDGSVMSNSIVIVPHTGILLLG